MEASRLNRVFLNLASTGGLPPDVTTFPSLLRDKAGYSTALVGKWHLGLHCGGVLEPDFCHHPNSHGFDHFFGLPLTNVRDFGNDEVRHSSVLRPFGHLFKALWVTILISFSMFLWMVVRRACGLGLFFLFVSVALTAVALPFHQFRAFSGVLMKNTQIVQQPLDLSGLTDRFVDEALGFLDSQSGKSPFVLFLAFTHVHTALIPGSKFAGKSKFGPYGDCLLEVDWAIGEILAKIKGMGVENETVVYFSSDNGAHQEEVMGDGSPAGGSNHPFKGGKGMGSMEGGIRVPSIIKYPKAFAPGTVVNVPTSQMDLLPTFARLAGVDLGGLTSVIDGKDMTDLLTGKTSKSPHDVLYHYCGTYLHGLRWVEDAGHVWKVRFAQPRFIAGTYTCEFICFCSPGDVEELNPPLLFNLVDDPVEDAPLDASSELYGRVMKVVESYRRNQELHLERNPVEDQFSLLNSLWRPWLQPCCDFGNMCSCENVDVRS
jgi:hypothetical protein